MNTSQAADSDISRVVAQLLNEAGVSHKAASERTGISRATLIRRLAGSTFQVSELRSIADLLGVSMSDILGQADRDVA